MPPSYRTPNRPPHHVPQPRPSMGRRLFLRGMPTAAVLGAAAILGRPPLATALESLYQPITILNAAGVDLNPGDVVAVSATANGAVALNDNINTRQIYVVAAEFIAKNTYGRFAASGEILVKTSAAIALGEYVQKGANRDVDRTGRYRIGAVPNLPPPDGALGHAIEPATAGYVKCFWYGEPQDDFTIANLHEFYEDFESGPAFTAPPGGAEEQWKYRWFRGSGSDSAAAYGIMRVAGDGGNAPFFALQSGGVFAKPFDPVGSSFYLVLEIRFAQLGVAAGTRRLGLSGTAITTADPANGVYFRHTAGGNIIVVSRAGGSESTVDTLVGAANGSMRTAGLIWDGNNGVHALMNGQRVGNPITTNLPAVTLGLSGGNSVGTAGNGFDVDAIRVLAPRSPFS